VSAPGVGKHVAPVGPDRWPAAAPIGDPGRAATTVVPRPDERFPFRHDIVSDSVRIPGDNGELHVMGASVRGLSHLYYGKVRQDAFGRLLSKDRRWLVASVADGVSSGDHSHVAADIVSQLGCVLLARQLEERDAAEIDWADVLHCLSSEIVGRAAERFGLVDPTLEEVAGKLASTALFAVVAVEPTEAGDRPVYVLSLGDTSAWVLHPDAEPAWESLQEVKNAGSVVASSATMALPGLPPRLPSPVATALCPGEVLVLMSDGVGDPLGGGTGEVGAALADAWREPPDPFTFTAQVGFQRRSYDDDRTVLAVWPVP
jgi:hypothetical protein